MASSDLSPRQSTVRLLPDPNRVLQHWQDQLWSEEQLFTQSAHFFQSMMEGIDSAAESIILATYIFDWDILGQQVVHHLGNARARGVDIRVLLDGVGSMQGAEQVIKALTRFDIAVRIYHPLPWQRENYRYALRRGSWIGNFITCLLKINQRHHAKLCIVDRAQLWSGSQNISASHLDKSSGGQGWHDYGIKVRGNAVDKAAQLFDDLWNYRKPKLGRGLFDHYWNNLSAITRQQKNHLLAKKIASAKHTVWIINPYFSPTRTIIRALRTASAAGVDVRIIVPNQSDIDFFPLLTATYYDELIKSSVRIFEYLPSILHAKLLLVDEFRLIGSTNLNHRSLLHDLEFDIVLESDAVIAQTKEQFLIDQQQCREITRDDVALFGWRRLLGWLPWLLRYWL